MAGHMGMLPPLCIDKIKTEVRGWKDMSSDVLQIDIFNILLFIYFKKWILSFVIRGCRELPGVGTVEFRVQGIASVGGAKSMFYLNL